MDKLEKIYFITLLITILFVSFVSMAKAQSNTLILAIDVSSSVNEEEMLLQMEGYAEALEYFPYLEDQYIEVILFSDYAVSVVQGSWHDAKAYFDDWYIPDEVYRGGMISAHRITCVSRVFEYIYENWSNYPGIVTIDISGDGEENCVESERVQRYAIALSENGAIINALVIDADNAPEVLNFERTYEFYDNYVINGFIEIAVGFEDIGDALYRKIGLEMSHLFGLQPQYDVLYY